MHPAHDRDHEPADVTRVCTTWVAGFTLLAGGFQVVGMAQKEVPKEEKREVLGQFVPIPGAIQGGYEASARL